MADIDVIDDDPWTGNAHARSRKLQEKTESRQSYMRSREHDDQRGWHTVVSPSARPQRSSPKGEKVDQERGTLTPERKIKRAIQRSSEKRTREYKEWQESQKQRVETKREKKEEVYLPRQKAEAIWSSFDPEIESKLTLHNTHALRKKSEDLLGSQYAETLDRDVEKDSLYKAALSPPPRAGKEGVTPVSLSFRPMLYDLFQDYRSKNREELDNMHVPSSPVHERRRPWSKPLSEKEIHDIPTQDFDEYTKKEAMQAHIDFPEKISVRPFENKEMVKLLIHEEIKGAKQRLQRATYSKHKQRLKEISLPARERAKLLTKRLEKETQGRADAARDSAFRERNEAEIRKAILKKEAGEPLLMIGKDGDKPIFGLRKIESVDAAMHDESFADKVGFIQLVERCADIRENKEDNLRKMLNAKEEFAKQDSAWEAMRRDPKYLMTKRFEVMKKKADSEVAVAQAQHDYCELFVLNEEDKKRWERLRQAPKKRATRQIQAAAAKAAEDARLLMLSLRSGSSERRADTRKHKGSKGKRPDEQDTTSEMSSKK